MAGREEYRIFVGGLASEVTESLLENAFSRFGKVLEAQYEMLPSVVHTCIRKIMLERDTKRPRGFGFITFGDRRAMDDAIRDMHGHELASRTISVNKAQPRMGGEEPDHGYRGGGGGYTSGARRSYGGGADRSVGQDECFKCGRPGHWARDCPSAGGGRGGGGGSFSSHSRFGGGGRVERFGGDHDRYIDDRYDVGRYGDRERFNSREDKYGSRDRYVSDRFPPADRYASDRYGVPDRYPPSSYGKDRGYDRDAGVRGGGDRYGRGGAARDDGGYRSRAGPYDRPSRGGRPSSFDRY